MEPVELVAAGFDQYSAVVLENLGQGKFKILMNPASGAVWWLPQWAR